MSPLLIALVSLAVSYFVIRFAVLSALRAHSAEQAALVLKRAGQVR